MKFVKPENILLTYPERFGARVGKYTGSSTSYIQANELLGEFKGLTPFFSFMQEFMAEPKHEGSSNQAKQGGFNFFNSLHEATDVYLYNPAKVREFEEANLAILGGESSGNSSDYDVTGDYLDIGRFLEGQPEVFGNMTDGNPRNRRVSISMNIVFASQVQQADINYRNTRLQRLVDWLESQQIRTQVVAICSSECCHLEIAIKEFDQILDMNDIAVVGHSDFFRRPTFRYAEYSDTWRYGYGNALNFSQYVTKKEFEPELNNEFSVFIDSNQISQATVKHQFDELEKWFETSLVTDVLTTQDRTIELLSPRPLKLPKVGE